MSQKSKANAAMKRRKEKRARKDANQAKYQAMRDAGQNTKSKRARMQNRKNRSTAKKHTHEVFDCGNIGCFACHPFGHRLVKGQHIFVTKRA
jgi:hypothetical protein